MLKTSDRKSIELYDQIINNHKEFYKENFHNILLEFMRICEMRIRECQRLTENLRSAYQSEGNFKTQCEQKDKILVEREMEIREMRADSAQLNQQLAQHVSRLGELNQSLACYKKQIQDILNSYSWRITAPLRALANLMSEITGSPSLQSKRSITVKQYQVRKLNEPNNNRPRIVHAIANFMMGGSSRLVVDLIEHLGHKYEQEIITSFIPDPPAYRGAVIHEYRQLSNPADLLPYLHKFRPDIIHVHYWGDCDWSWYDRVFRASEQIGCKIVENINTPVKPYLSLSISRYVYVSNYVLKTFGMADEISDVIYPGSDFALFERGTNEELPVNCIGMVYRLESDKLNAQSIDVFIKVARRRPRTKILIVGGGTFLEPYKEAVERAGVMESFNFTGYVSYDSLPNCYRQMSIFVVPVWNESFGQVSSFAMNMGIPVAGYNIGALREILGTDETLAPAGDSDRLADIIIALLDNRLKMMNIGAANKIRAKSFFSVEAMINAYEKLYADLTSSH